MQVVKAQMPCASCGKLIWVSEGQDPLCQGCKNHADRTKQGSGVRLISEKVNFKEQVNMLRYLENRYPKVLEEIRQAKKKVKR